MCVPVCACLSAQAGACACACLHAGGCALIRLASPDPLFAGTVMMGAVMGARPVVWQFPTLFIVKKVNRSAGFSGSEGKGYLLSTGEGRGGKRC